MSISSPVQGAILFALNVNTMAPVSFTPLWYCGCKLFIPVIVPVPSVSHSKLPEETLAFKKSRFIRLSVAHIVLSSPASTITSGIKLILMISVASDVQGVFGCAVSVNKTKPLLISSCVGVIVGVSEIGLMTVDLFPTIVVFSQR